MSNNPRQFPIVYKNVRRALLRRFPYSLLFVMDGDELIVIACFHASRGPVSTTIVALSTCDSQVKDKTAEQILAASDCSYEGPIGYYLVAAQVGTNQELATASSPTGRCSLTGREN